MPALATSPVFEIEDVAAGLAFEQLHGRVEVGCWLKVREETVGVRRVKKVVTFSGGYSGAAYVPSYTDRQGHYHSGYVPVSGTGSSHLRSPHRRLRQRVPGCGR